MEVVSNLLISDTSWLTGGAFQAIRILNFLHYWVEEKCVIGSCQLEVEVLLEHGVPTLESRGYRGCISYYN